MTISHETGIHARGFVADQQLLRCSKIIYDTVVVVTLNLQAAACNGVLPPAGLQRYS
jgi:hypothetical protein